MKKRPISSDSHVTEPPDLFVKHIDPAFRDRAPFIEQREKYGDVYVIPGHPIPVPMGHIAAAGRDPATVSAWGVKFEDIYRGGWDPRARVLDQDRDGLEAEIIYPTVGMVTCTHPDSEYKRACFQAYNRWLEGFVAGAPDRLIGIGQLMVDADLDRVLRDIEEIRSKGFKGLMLPAEPECWEEHDYDDAYFDPLWNAIAATGMPITFHIQTSRQYLNALAAGKVRGAHVRMLSFLQSIRLSQDLIGIFVFGGVFERHPKLKMVSVEADAGWLPHFIHRMDHGYVHHRRWLRGKELKRLPSAYVNENVYLTFQDDKTAFQFKDQMNLKRLLWANDFPHTDSTWPNSQEVLSRYTAFMTETERNSIVHDNTAELYGLPSAAPSRGW